MGLEEEEMENKVERMDEKGDGLNRSEEEGEEEEEEDEEKGERRGRVRTSRKDMCSRVLSRPARLDTVSLSCTCLERGILFWMRSCKSCLLSGKALNL